MLTLYCQFLKAIGEGEADLDGDGWITFSEVQSDVMPAASTPLQTPGVSCFPSHEQGETVFRTPPARGGSAAVASPSTTRTGSLRTEGGASTFASTPAAIAVGKTSWPSSSTPG